MERQPVSSSNIASVGYKSDSETLEIEFLKNGAVYEYYNVPQLIYDQMMQSASIGQFFNSDIKNSYACSQI
ncbi:KTSC domain-containing protein [Pseudoxanthomonas sp.]|uniref:KTSC domain-containing protein n=1 Tax=Pseudoxanthomonas sp. TaxID=1871049 RepID=UPI0026080F98|nr:KTSC domain-containing protein [Pseudoxanthomonas sp.]WDS35274.1 MAG: KTSC domain-containing protein [Pseudoxanthomonas sp.]